MFKLLLLFAVVSVFGNLGRAEEKLDYWVDGAFRSENWLKNENVKLTRKKSEKSWGGNLRSWLREKFTSSGTDCGDGEYQSDSHVAYRGCRAVDTNGHIFCCGDCDRELCSAGSCVGCNSVKCEDGTQVPAKSFCMESFDAKAISSLVDISNYNPDDGTIVDIAGAWTSTMGLLSAIGLLDPPLSLLVDLIDGVVGIISKFSESESGLGTTILDLVENLIAQEEIHDLVDSVESYLKQINTKWNDLKGDFNKGSHNIQQELDQITTDFWTILGGCDENAGAKTFAAMPFRAVAMYHRLQYFTIFINSLKMEGNTSELHDKRSTMLNEMLDYSATMQDCVNKYIDARMERIVQSKKKEDQWSEVLVKWTAEDQWAKDSAKEWSSYESDWTDYGPNQQAYLELLQNMVVSDAVKLFGPFQFLPRYLGLPETPFHNAAKDVAIGPWHPRMFDARCCTETYKDAYDITYPQDIRIQCGDNIDEIALCDGYSTVQPTGKCPYTSGNGHGKNEVEWLVDDPILVMGVKFVRQSDHLSDVYVASQGKDHIRTANKYYPDVPGQAYWTYFRTPGVGLLTDHYKLNTWQMESSTPRYHKVSFKWDGPETPDNDTIEQAIKNFIPDVSQEKIDNFVPRVQALYP